MLQFNNILIITNDFSKVLFFRQLFHNVIFWEGQCVLDNSDLNEFFKRIGVITIVAKITKTSVV